jgi:hypothetical protein
MQAYHQVSNRDGSPGVCFFPRRGYTGSELLLRSGCLFLTAKRLPGFGLVTTKRSQRFGIFTAKRLHNKAQGNHPGSRFHHQLTWHGEEKTTTLRKTMNVFQLIETVLTEAYEAIPGSEAKKDAAITAALESLGAQYSKLLSAGCLDYSNPATRFAYIHRYTTSHANLVYSIVGKSGALGPLFDRDKLSIACIGGGPGSDFFGHPQILHARREKTPAEMSNLRPGFRVGGVME